MAAEPPDGTRPAGPQPHRYRQIAESFGEDPGRYDRTRPTYPAALVDRIISASPGRDVLDVGCGTGTAARQFLAAGCPVLGVEPDGRMAEFARRSGVEVEVATFEAWDPAGRDFDAVVAGTAWHWVDPVVGAAKAAQVLRPGGRLAPFNHVFQPPPEVAGALVAAFWQVVPDSPGCSRSIRFAGRRQRPSRTGRRSPWPSGRRPASRSIMWVWPRKAAGWSSLSTWAPPPPIHPSPASSPPRTGRSGSRCPRHWAAGPWSTERRGPVRTRPARAQR
jgi:SAM-dependent methyltransferase